MLNVELYFNLGERNNEMFKLSNLNWHWVRKTLDKEILILDCELIFRSYLILKI